MEKTMIVFEMANNHMGDVSHGVKLVNEFSQFVDEFDSFEFGFKLQYRNLDTFIHSSVKGDMSIKYVKRFEETRLKEEDFIFLLKTMETCGFKRICTPFDEDSVDTIEKHGIEIIKIASCSFTDWPLLERIVCTNKPVIASTAGASLEEIDRVVSFFNHRKKLLTIMQCTAEYPTPDENLRLAQIRSLQARYPEIQIGYSTHENPDRIEPGMLAFAMGARVFEKHVALPNETYKANAYSVNPNQTRDWLNAISRAQLFSGTLERQEATGQERKSLQSLRRGVYAIREIAPGKTITKDDIEFAFPPVEGQITANDWSKYNQFKARKNITQESPVLFTDTEVTNSRQQVLDAVRKVEKLLKKSNVIVPGHADLEVSHHYGMGRFNEYGLTLITVVNREYCKKLLILLPAQEHPEQYHKQKEETFMVLDGEMDLWLDDVLYQCKPGEVITVAPGVRHRFRSERGVVLEEISTTHYKDDSFYTDVSIMENKNRKTLLNYWLGA